MVTNISSDQTKTSVPIIIDLHGHDERRGALSIYGELNYLEEEPRKSFEMKYDGFSLAKSKISPSELLPYELSEGIGELGLELDIISKRIKSEIGYKARQVSFDFSDIGAPKTPG